LRSGTLHGFEALLRWQHPRRGLVPPGQFLDALELTGLVVPVGRWVIETALAQQRAWLDQGLGECTVAVNLSVRQFSDLGLLEAVDAALRHHAIAPSRLVVEVTESMLIRDPGQAQKILHGLHARGCRIAVDDFGTGYASLAYLQRFPAHHLKLDRSFVSRLATDAKSRAIVDASLAMARGLAIEVVAEGIESVFERDYLREKGCPYGQGYLFAKPLAVDEATACLARGRPLGG
jgi:EAL domain-containing protein (putative c-di-GMP-specific phosphodiesterase class I)